MIPEPKSEALRALYWRDEILQVAFWIHGEGLGDEIGAPLLERFLGVPAARITPYLQRMATDGLLVAADDGRYRLSERGADEGGRIFSEEFAELTRPAHGECGDDCWCRTSPDEADACLEERLGHVH